MNSSTPITLILFGFTGNLSRRKILPSWWFLYDRGLLPQSWRIIGIGRSDLSTTALHSLIERSVGEEWTVANPEKRTDFLSRIFYVSGDVRQDEIYKKIGTSIRSQPPNAVIVYISTFPKLYAEIIAQLKYHAIFKHDDLFHRLLIEKPFGTDTQSSQALNVTLQTVLDEKDVYRIDHYLAKETVQNILAFRFANGVFEHLWSNQFIDHIQLTYAESGGVEGREEFFNEVGIIRDVIQNHVLQLLSVVMMEEPSVLEPSHIQHKRFEVLSHFTVLSSKEVKERCLLGMYKSGKSKVVSPTAIAVELAVENERWKGVPIFVRAGKKFPMNVIEVSIFFKEPINRMFSKQSTPQIGNILTFRIQPNEGIALWLNLKRPGLDFKIERVPMSFCYKSQFSKLSLIEAYSKVLFDALEGNSSLFLDAHGTDACWRIVEPLLTAKDDDIKKQYYADNTWGPPTFNDLYTHRARVWMEPDLGVCSI